MLPGLLLLSMVPEGPKRVMVLPVVIPEDHAGVTPADLARSVRSGLSRTSGLSLVEEEQLPSTREESPRTMVASCGADERCLVEVVEKLDIDLAVLAVLIADRDPPLLALLLADVNAGRIIVRDAGPLAPGASIEARAATFLREAGFVSLARLEIQAQPPAAIVRVDGAPLALRSLDVAPGVHDVEATLEGYLTLREQVAVGPGEVKRVELSLEAETTFPWWWIAIAVVVVAAAAGSAAAIAARPDCVCVSPDPASCPPC